MQRFCKIAILGVFLLSLSTLGSAQSEDELKGLMPGQQAPDFSAVNQYGHAVSLADYLAKGPTAIIFYRGYWCPVCNRHLKTMQDSLSLLQEKGINIVAISPEMPERVERTIEKTAAAFDILHDKDLKIGLAYDVIFDLDKGKKLLYNTALGAKLEEANSDGSIRLPIPATYLIDRDGTILYRQFDANYKKRSSVAEIIEALIKE
jgi:peroxiredoxin